ncbi:MAG: TerB family tellurite resistance protein [Gammaproteobacteria bacterium]|nr:TerB family tellurite resistance protein [Gammaproteobacteria bacterium]MBU2675506.1 TerB family tellurite resistance protein [Gammaproteobacteria bacterium]NNC57589.1 TerB family tellurite resistance protein [Woeseiaceae bacterium]NNL49241.1 TerB family tellurite resistance protein [Woeseiaceae bacterium]
MIRRFIDQVVGAIKTPQSAESGDGDREAALRMATAVLMLDVARADDVFDEIELDRILDLIQTHFELPSEAAAELVVAAREKSEDAVSAYEFTKILHDHLDENEKARVVALLWQIAYADGRLDMYEDALVLKISDLLHVSRGRVMRLKYDAKQNA